MKINKNYILCGILMLGLVVRLYSINYGLPFVVGPDENRQVLDAFGMGARLSLIPQDFAYGALHKYLLLFVYGIYFLIGKLIGIFPDKLAFAFKFMTEPYSFYLAGRLLSVALGVGTIFIIYKAAKELFNWQAALLAAMFAALDFHLVQLSYWISADILLVFLSAAAFLFIFKVAKNADLKDLFFASLSVGLAISTKYQGVLLLVPLCVTVVLVFYKDKKLFRIILGTALFVFLASLVGNLQYILRFQGAMDKLKEILNASQLGISSAPVFGHNFLEAGIWYFRQLMRQDGLIGLAFCCAAFYALFKIKERKNIIFLVSLFTFLLFFSRSSLRYVYYGALFFPLFCIFAAGLFFDLYRKGGLQKTVAACFIMVLIAIALVDILNVGMKRAHPDTRQLARIWIEENIPQEEAIALDWPELSVPIESDEPIMIRTAKAYDFYKSNIPPALRIRYNNFMLQNKKYYRLIPVIYEKKEDFLPCCLDKQVIQRINNSYFAKRLYGYFNFLDLDKLKASGARYLVISSYSYAHFLVDDDPQKTELFNPYIKEDTLINNRQAKEYNPANKESVLFFLAKRARDFYLPLLREDEPRVVLLKEFAPDIFNLGPVIRIYRLN